MPRGLASAARLGVLSLFPSFIETLPMALPGTVLFRRVFSVPYAPEPSLRTFLERAQTQQRPAAEVTVAVLDAEESGRLFGVPLARRGLQPVF
jgi:hypothetical protein